MGELFTPAFTVNRGIGWTPNIRPATSVAGLALYWRCIDECPMELTGLGTEAMMRPVNRLFGQRIRSLVMGVGIFLAAMGAWTPANAALPRGAVDPSWGVAGVADTGPFLEHAAAVQTRPDGSTLVIGIENDQLRAIGLDGSGVRIPGSERVIDSSVAWDRIEAVRESLDVSGDTFILASEKLPSGALAFRVIRIDPGGGLRTTFGFGGRLPLDDWVEDVLPVPGNRILIAGHSSDANYVGKFDAETGALDTSFGTGGAIQFGGTNAVRAIAADASGRYLIATADDAGTQRLQRVDSMGTVDAGFGENGLVVISSGVRDVVVRSLTTVGDRVIVAGGHGYANDSGRGNGHARGFTATVSAEGLPSRIVEYQPPEITSAFEYFHPVLNPGDVFDSSVRGFTDSGASVLAVGSVNVSAYPAAPLVLGFDSNGAKDSGFGADGISIPRLMGSDGARNQSGVPIVNNGRVLRVVTEGPTDHAAPALALAPPDLRIRYVHEGATNIAYSRRLTFTWRSSDADGPVATEIGWRVGDSPVRARFTTARSFVFRIPAGSYGCMMLRAWDAVGRRSPWKYRCYVAPEREGALQIGPGWSRIRAARYGNGVAFSTTAPHRTMSTPLPGDQDTILMLESCSKCGSIRIRDGAGWRTIHLRSTTRRRMLVPLRAELEGSRPFRLISLGTGRVTVDGLLVLRGSYGVVR